ncbi:MAG: DoxX family protein [Patescibacteria group bacterium]|nr:DoxX family protein [Patescibacteria group bacterium]
MRSILEKTVWSLLRIGMGWIFFWAFIDKLWGLGFTTKPESAWLEGGSPTLGFLNFATKGPFADVFQGLAGSSIVDWVFMAGLLFVGVALILGIAMKLAAYSGALMMILMYVAGFIPPEHNPILDDHIIYAFLLLGLYFSGSGRWLGFGSLWSRTFIARKIPILR